MATIHSLRIRNFRGIHTFDATFNTGIQCIIGRGDTGKTTILEAISFLLSPSYTLQFCDSDFYANDTSQNIEISAVLLDVEDDVLKRHALCACGLDSSGNLRDDFEADDMEDCKDIALHIFLRVEKDLEPHWTVEAREHKEPISAMSRSELGMTFINEYADRHFSFSRGGFLYRKAKEEKELNIGHQELSDIVRDAKTKINESLAGKFPHTISKIQTAAVKLGLQELDITPYIDAKELMVGEGSLSLSTRSIPLKRMGKGSRKLLSAAIQLSDTGRGIILIDELEIGLEPDRIINLINGLRQEVNAQIILTTHSSTVLQELRWNELRLKTKASSGLQTFTEKEQSLLRSNPSAFFAKRIIVCEGRTEYGFMRAFEEYRRFKGLRSMSSQGVVCIDGNGADMIPKAKRLIEKGYQCLVFCDNDVDAINKQKASLTGISIVECKETFCFEKQLFQDAPWAFIVEFLQANAMYSIAVYKSLYNNDSPENEDWYKEDSPDIRAKMGELSILKETTKGGKEKDKSWFKNINASEELGLMLFCYSQEFDNYKLFFKNLEKINNWIEYGYTEVPKQ